MKCKNFLKEVKLLYLLGTSRTELENVGMKLKMKKSIHRLIP